MENCIFCKLGNGEIPSDKIYEDANFIAFFDINPVADGHLLVIPKEHIVWMQDAEDALVGDIFILAKKLMSPLKEILKCDLVQVAVVGDEVPHFHIHLIPRYKDDRLKTGRQAYNKQKSLEIAKKLIEAL